MKRRILVVAAHPDDEVLGCGGTVARWACEGHVVNMVILADGEGARAENEDQTIDLGIIEQRIAIAREACNILGCESVDVLNMKDNRLDGMELLDIVKAIEIFIKKYEPHTVLTHHAGDVNIDHRIVHDAVIAACRPEPGHLVKELLFFEVPSSTEWRPPSSSQYFMPNYFVDISQVLETKLDALRAYKNELRTFPHPRSLKAVEYLARWRGATVGVEAAESFIVGRKII
jgi:N-acetylglucosamine malate deacetylase 1